MNEAVKSREQQNPCSRVKGQARGVLVMSEWAWPWEPRLRQLMSEASGAPVLVWTRRGGKRRVRKRLASASPSFSKHNYVP